MLQAPRVGLVLLFQDYSLGLSCSQSNSVKGGCVLPWSMGSLSRHRRSFSGPVLGFIKSVGWLPVLTPFLIRVAETQHEFRSLS